MDMQMERDAVGWRQIMVVFGVLILVGTAMALALATDGDHGAMGRFEPALFFVLVAIYGLERILRGPLARAWAWIGLSPRAEFRLKCGVVYAICLLSLAVCALAVITTRAING
jgi:hypothetical protein